MTIVVGYTATPSARAALDQAIALASKEGQRLVVVTGARERGQRDSRRLDQEQSAELDRLLESTGLEVVRLSPESEDEPAEQILDAARTHAADLIVIGVRRRSPVGKFLLGSAAQRILLDADCPVLAVKAQS
jgi:nucleotide-binding universal stress UspA family protein